MVSECSSLATGAPASVVVDFLDSVIYVPRMCCGASRQNKRSNSAREIESIYAPNNACISFRMFPPKPSIHFCEREQSNCEWRPVRSSRGAVRRVQNHQITGKVIELQGFDLPHASC